MTTEKQLTIFTALSAIWIDEEGILNVKALREGEMDLDEAERCFKAYRELGCYKNKVLQLLDLTVPILITKEAREYVDSQAPAIFIASAVISESLAIRLIINFMSLFRPSIPLKMFSKKEEGLEWLRKHKSEFR